jgi:hypothetical protein
VDERAWLLAKAILISWDLEDSVEFLWRGAVSAPPVNGWVSQ